MTFYRNVVWFAKGMREYTKGGYEKGSKLFNAADMDVDVTGRIFMITGANSGLGKATALDIAKKGGTVHMVCRSKERGEQALEEIKTSSGNENIHLHLLDMAKPKEVYAFAKNYCDSGEPLHVLVNNAGCMINEREVIEEGYEKNFATNTLATYILTRELEPALSKSDKARVIIVTSGGMLTTKLDNKDMQFENMKPFDGTFAYAQNKRQQVVITEQCGKRYPKIHFSCMHPGWADTPAVRNSMPGFHAKMKNRLRTPEQGADTLSWLAISDAPLKLETGQFFQDRVAVAKHLPLAWTKSKPEEETELMTKLDEMVDKLKE